MKLLNFNSEKNEIRFFVKSFNSKISLLKAVIAIKHKFVEIKQNQLLPKLFWFAMLQQLLRKESSSKSNPVIDELYKDTVFINLALSEK